MVPAAVTWKWPPMRIVPSVLKVTLPLAPLLVVMDTASSVVRLPYSVTACNCVPAVSKTMVPSERHMVPAPWVMSP